jgi:hypothetical protein
MIVSHPPAEAGLAVAGLAVAGPGVAGLAGY